MKNTINGRYYKYIHLLWSNELKFNGPVVKLINKLENNLKPEEHAFITRHEQVYKALKDYGNVFLDDNNKNLFNTYADSCNWLISHGYPEKQIVLMIKKKAKRKIVYRYWGGRRNPKKMIKGQPIRNLVRRGINSAYNYFFRKTYEDLPLIGIANIVDTIDLRKLLKNTPLMRMPYIGEGRQDALLKTKQKHTRSDGYLHVLIGHRSEPSEHHIYYLELLRKFEYEKIKIFIPLSYGDAEYAESVKNYVKEENLENVTIVDEFMDYSKYVEFLNDMDIGLIDCDNSLALGNIGILLRLGKTLYISRNGVIKEAFDLEKVPYHCLDEIKNMDFSQFSKLLTIDENSSEEFKSHGYEYHIDRWRDIFAFLDDKLDMQKHIVD